MNEGQQYTRGSQVLTPSDVEYLFRGVNDDLGRVENRLRSLATHFRGVDAEIADKLEVAVSNTMIARSTANGVKRKAMPALMPHRLNAGEHEHW